jgi:FAD/FMN-containing dehydrogenase
MRIVEWLRAGAARIACRQGYAAMRPFMPRASYANDCDIDLPDYATAHWGDNLTRLMAVKQQYDPENLFQHAQSVPAQA